MLTSKSKLCLLQELIEDFFDDLLFLQLSLLLTCLSLYFMLQRQKIFAMVRMIALARCIANGIFQDVTVLEKLLFDDFLHIAVIDSW